MRAIVITFLTILFYQILLAQKTEVYFGEPNRLDYANGLIEDYDHGYYIIGGFEGEKGWNIKTDINSDMLYDKVLEHNIYDIATRGCVTDEDGNKYICGPKFNNTTWPYVIKLNYCGELIWCKLLNNDLFEDGTARDILINKSDEIVVLVRYDSEEEIDVIHLIGLNSYGDILWTKPYASRNDYPWIREPFGYSLEEINNEYYISGYCYWPYPNDTNHVFLRPLFIGIDSLFNEKWILPFYALDSVFGTAYKTLLLNDTTFMGVGIRRAYNSSNEDNALLMFYNNNGDELGYNEIYNDQIGPDIHGSVIRDIVRINDTLFLAASLFGPDYGGNPVGEFVIDTAANLYNFESRPNTVTSPKLIKTYDNNYVIATSIREDKSDWDIYLYKIDENLEDVPFDPTPHTYDSLCPGGIQSGIIDLTACLYTGIGEIPTPQEYYASLKLIPVKAYPNPVSEGSITFEFENTEHHSNMELKCFDIYGEEVHKEKVYRYQGESVVDVSRWKNGMYVVVVYSKGVPVGRCKFVINH